MALKPYLMSSDASLASNRPEMTLTVDPTRKILGGGAKIDYSGAGCILTASYPLDVHSWFALGKDHETPDSSGIMTIYVVVIDDPNDDWDVIIVKGVSANPASQPIAIATLPYAYTLTGGGASVDWRGDGNLLTASRPYAADPAKPRVWDSWEARSKDHQVSDPSTITAYAIGIRPSCTNPFHGFVTQAVGGGASGPPEAHPTVGGLYDRACADPHLLPAGPNWVRSGGGAIDRWDDFGGAGNMLTASYPDPDNPDCWLAAGKDHNISSPSIVDAYVIFIAEFPTL